jgi:hypothetical protein
VASVVLEAGPAGQVAGEPMMGVRSCSCGLRTHTYRAGCENAHGPWAGALITALGGLCAERRRVVDATTTRAEVTDIGNALLAEVRDAMRNAAIAKLNGQRLTIDNCEFVSVRGWSLPIPKHIGDPLTPKQLEFAACSIAGFTHAEMAAILVCTPGTVKYHLCAGAMQRCLGFTNGAHGLAALALNPAAEVIRARMREDCGIDKPWGGGRDA